MMRKNIFRILLVIILGIGGSQEVMAQEAPNLQNLETLDVDQLTDEQVKKFIDRVESSGYTEQQLEVLARARGMSSSQIAKLRARIAKVRSGSTTTGSDSGVDRSRTTQDYNRQTNDQERSTVFDPFTNIFPEDTLSKEDELEIFGLSFFRNKNLTFEPSLSIATPKSYVIGAGDQIIIDVWGASEQTYQLEVSPDGSIIVPSIGPIYLNGLSMEQAEIRIKNRLKSIYSTLGNNTFAQVGLGQIRTISVNVVGEVVNPGTYQISSFGTAFNALYLAGGPNESGSLREIQVYRGGKKEATLDAYNFLVYGEGQNIMLQDQDVLLVKPYVSRIAIEGEVKRPAYYETREAESLEKAIDFAGGFTAGAYTKSISVRRNLDNRKTVETIPKARFNEFILSGGDKVEVGKIQNQFVGRVRIEGAVNHPGEFELTEGLMLSEVLKDDADGLRADAFLERGVVIRQNDDLSLASLAFSPRAVMSGDEDLALQSEDLVKIQSKFDLREQYTVSIQGEVQSPGSYPYADDMTVENLIYMANGFKETAAKSFVEVARRVVEEENNGEHTAKIFNFPISSDLSLSNEAVNFSLKPFDLVVIRKSPFYEEQAIVEVEGEVQYPGKYALEAKNERISDVLNRAGSLTKYAYPKGATLIRRTEYYVTGEDEGDEAARLRREELQELLERDTLVTKNKEAFKTQESIGIQLEEILKAPGSKYDLILKEGDIVSIPRELQTVRIRGEVLYPSNVRYDNSNNFQDFISQAGGFSDNAKKGKTYVVYANGSAKQTKSFLWFKDYPPVEPGAEIIIPSRPQRQGLSPQALISLTSGVATLSLVILRVIDQL